jgi:hypothetical protein
VNEARRERRKEEEEGGGKKGVCGERMPKGMEKKESEGRGDRALFFTGWLKARVTAYFGKVVNKQSRPCLKRETDSENDK